MGGAKWGGGQKIILRGQKIILRGQKIILGEQKIILGEQKIILPPPPGAATANDQKQVSENELVKP